MCRICRPPRYYHVYEHLRAHLRAEHQIRQIPHIGPYETEYMSSTQMRRQHPRIQAPDQQEDFSAVVADGIQRGIQAVLQSMGLPQTRAEIPASGRNIRVLISNSSASIPSSSSRAGGSTETPNQSRLGFDGENQNQLAPADLEIHARGGQQGQKHTIHSGGSDEDTNQSNQGFFGNENQNQLVPVDQEIHARSGEQDQEHTNRGGGNDESSNQPSQSLFGNENQSPLVPVDQEIHALSGEKQQHQQPFVVDRSEGESFSDDENQTIPSDPVDQELHAFSGEKEQQHQQQFVVDCSEGGSQVEQEGSQVKSQGSNDHEKTTLLSEDSSSSILVIDDSIYESETVIKNDDSQPLTGDSTIVMCNSQQIRDEGLAIADASEIPLMGEKFIGQSIELAHEEVVQTSGQSSTQTLEAQSNDPESIHEITDEENSQTPTFPDDYDKDGKPIWKSNTRRNKRNGQ